MQHNFCHVPIRDKLKKILQIDETMMVALSEQTIDKAIVKIIDNLYLLPSDDDFTEYPKFLERKFLPTKEGYEEKRIGYFSSQLSKVKDDYDYVIVDVPPTLSIFTDSAVYASDDIIIVLQTQQQSLDGAIGFFNYLQRTYDEYQPVDFDILGVLLSYWKTELDLILKFCKMRVKCLVKTRYSKILLNTCSD